MGIQNRVVARYGQRYWDRNKKDILKVADKHDKLNAARSELNARQRRYLARHPEPEELEEEFGGEVITIRGKQRGVVRDALGRFLRWFSVSNV